MLGKFWDVGYVYRGSALVRSGLHWGVPKQLQAPGTREGNSKGRRVAEESMKRVLPT